MVQSGWVFRPAQRLKQISRAQKIDVEQRGIGFGNKCQCGKMDDYVGPNISTLY